MPQFFSLFISFLLASMCECASARVYISGLFNSVCPKMQYMQADGGYNYPIRPVFLLFWRQNAHFWIFLLAKTVLAIEYTSKRPPPKFRKEFCRFFVATQSKCRKNFSKKQYSCVARFEIAPKFSRVAGVRECGRVR